MGVFKGVACVLALFCAGVSCNGCAVVEAQRAQREDENRIHDKQMELQNEQARNATLSQQKDALTTELSQRNFTLDELSQRLQQLRATNAGSTAETDSLRQENQRLTQQLHDLNAQLVAVRGATDLSMEQKQARIAHLRTQINVQLELLLH